MMRIRSITGVLLAIGLIAGSGCAKKENTPLPNQRVIPANSASSSSQAPAPATVAKPSPKKVTGKLPGGAELPGPYEQVPFITWGGDFPLLYGNGGETTRDGTIFAKYGLKIKLVRGDNVQAQLADYKAGKTNLLRGTHGMIGKHWQSLCTKSDLCPQWFLAETKSAGDFLYCRDTVKQVKDLKNCSGHKCKIAMQKDGPHEDFLLAVLEEDAKATWADVEIVWATNLTGKTDSPDALLRSDPSIDCAFGITPDMMAAVGTVTSIGTGADNTLKGGHVVTSTFHRRESIVDLFAVSTKFASTPEGKEWLHKFRAAYLESVEQMITLRKAYDAGGNEEFESAMTALSQMLSDALPTPDDAIGLYADAGFLGHAGNVSFFDPSNSVGITYHNVWGNKLAKILATSTADTQMQTLALPWDHSVYNNLTSRTVSATPTLQLEATRSELEKMRQDGTLGANMMVYHTAQFGEDEVTIADFKPYEASFDEILKDAQRYSHAPIVIRGHVDPTRMVIEIIKAGLRDGSLKQVGQPGAYRYYADGEELSVTTIRPWLKRLEAKAHDLKDENGVAIIQYVNMAETQSGLRVKSLSDGLKAYAEKKGIKIKNVIDTESVGLREPLIAKARSAEEAATNRRVEFSIVKTGGEAVTSKSDFEL